MSIFKGRAVHSKKLLAWRKLLVDSLKQAKAPPFTGATYCYLTFLLPRPKSVARDRPSVKPDLDKLVRAALDACEIAGLLENDSRVCEIQAVKRYCREGEDPKLCLYLREMPDYYDKWQGLNI